MLTEKLIGSGRYEGKDDFTVVVQPFLKNFTAPRQPNGKIDLTFFAPDCFHLSTKGHGNNKKFKRFLIKNNYNLIKAAIAIGIWNNMLQPVGNKSITLNIDDTIKCPTKKHPYFFTNINSIKDFENL